MSLRKAIQQIGETFDKVENLYYGDLGIIKGNKKLVKVQNRPGFVYVRLRGARSELITAHNDKVEEKYGTPVVLKREGNRYSVIGKNWERYQDWDGENPSLPKHSKTHTFDKDGNVIGSDGVFVSGYQFLPYLLCPLGTNSTNAFIYPFADYFNNQWTYYGNTGTVSFTPYKPVSGTSLVLVSIDYETGNPYYQATTGTYISNLVTGISQILPYLPTPPTGTIVPIGAVRLTSTTQSINWLNIYDLRKHYETVLSASTGGGNPGGNDTEIQVNNSGEFAGYPSFRRQSNGAVIIGDISEDLAIEPYSLGQGADGSSIANFLESFGNSVASYIAFLRARGTHDAPAAVQNEDVIGRIRGRGYDGSGWTNTKTEIRFIAEADWSGSETPTRIELWTTPTGSATMTKVFTINADGNVNIEAGKQYQVNGSQHQHDAADIASGTIDTARLPNQFVTNSNDIFALSSVGSSGWTGTINGTPSGTTVNYTHVSGNKNTLVPTSTSQLGKQRLYNTTRGNYALILTSNGTSTITLTASVPSDWANGDTITTISTTVVSGQNHVDIEITSGELVGKTNVFLWAVILDSGSGVFMRFHPFETFSVSKQFNIFSPSAGSAFGGLQAYKLVNNVLTIAWSASGTSTVSPTVRQVGYVK